MKKYRKLSSDGNMNFIATKIVILFFIFVSIVLLVLGPLIISSIISTAYTLLSGLLIRKILLYLLGYSCGIVAIRFLYLSYIFVGNVEKSIVFTDENMTILQKISTDILIAIILSLIIGVLCFYPFLALAGGEIFAFSVFLTIEKIFEKAIIMKDELDYTI